MDQETPELRALPSEVRERIDHLATQLAAMQEISTQAFAARQGFYEKLILLNGATLTLAFTVVGSVSHSTIAKDSFHAVGQRLLLGCSLFILSIMLSLLHNHLNIVTVVNSVIAYKKANFHSSRLLLRVAMKEAGIQSEMNPIALSDPESLAAMKKGATTETLCRWVGFAAQSLTILGYLAFVATLRTVIVALG